MNPAVLDQNAQTNGGSQAASSSEPALRDWLSLRGLCKQVIYFMASLTVDYLVLLIRLDLLSRRRAPSNNQRIKPPQVSQSLAEVAHCSLLEQCAGSHCHVSLIHTVLLPGAPREGAASALAGLLSHVHHRSDGWPVC